MSILIGSWMIVIGLYLLVIRKDATVKSVLEKQLPRGIIPDSSDAKNTPFQIMKCDF